MKISIACTLDDGGGAWPCDRGERCSWDGSDPGQAGERRRDLPGRDVVHAGLRLPVTRDVCTRTSTAKYTTRSLCRAHRYHGTLFGVLRASLPLHVVEHASQVRQFLLPGDSYAS